MEEYILETPLPLIWLVAFLFLCARYLIIAGGAYLLFWKLIPNRIKHRQIQPVLPEKHHLKRDFLYSVVTFTIFAVIGAAIVVAYRQGYTQVYFDSSKYGGAPYMILSLILLLVLHDLFFYWAHRVMHLPAIFPHVHRVHHLSTNPSPWSSFAFHPIEGVVEGLILPLGVFIIPLHFNVIIVFFLIMTTMNAIGHLGYELYPSKFTTSLWSKWNNTSTHHNMHHKYANCNYGLYFNWWDTICKTNHPDYLKNYQAITTRSREASPTSDNK